MVSWLAFQTFRACSLIRIDRDLLKDLSIPAISATALGGREVALEEGWEADEFSETGWIVIISSPCPWWARDETMCKTGETVTDKTDQGCYKDPTVEPAGPCLAEAGGFTTPRQCGQLRRPGVGGGNVFVVMNLLGLRART